MGVTSAVMVAICKVKKFNASPNSQDFCSVKLDMIGSQISIMVPRSFCFDSKGAQTLKEGAEYFIKAELTQDNNVKSFDGNFRASLSYRVETILEFRLATDKDVALVG